MKKNILILLSLILLSSCNDLFHIEKRKYLRGYYVSFAGDKHNHNQNKENKTDADRRSTAKYINAVAENIQQQKVQTIVDLNEYSSLNGDLNTNQNPTPQKNNTSNNIYASTGTDPNTYTLKVSKNSVSHKEASSKTKNENTSDTFFLLLAGLFCGFVSLALQPLYTRPTNMVSWASKNRLKSIALISVARVFICALGMFVGRNLHEMGMVTSEISTYVLLALAAVSAFLYTVKDRIKNVFTALVKRQNVFGLLLTIAGFLLMANITNRACADKTVSPIANSVVHSIDYIKNGNNCDTHHDNIDSNHGKDIKYGNGGQILLTILAVILFLGLMFGAGMLSCMLSCNGQEALSALVLIIGIPGGIILLVQAIRAIWKPVKKMKTEEIK